MDHIERDQCTGISSDEFETSRAKQAYRLGRISALIVTEDDRSEGVIDTEPGCAPVESALAFDDIPQDDEEAFRLAFPALRSPDVPDETFEKKVPKAPVDIAKAVREVPKASGPASQSLKNVGSTVSERGRISTDTPAFSAKIAAEFFEEARKYNLPADIHGLALNDKSNVPILKDHAGNILDTTSPSFNPERFRNVIGKYKCPYPGCGRVDTIQCCKCDRWLILSSKSFNRPREFTSHLNSPTHKGVDSRCPSCLRCFKSPTALTQHMESPSSRCHIKDSTHFDTAVSLVSGGFLEVTGRHVGGEIMYDAADPNVIRVSGLV